MFDHQHYVPVMRMKPAELRTLRDDRGRSVAIALLLFDATDEVEHRLGHRGVRTVR